MIADVGIIRVFYRDIFAGTLQRDPSTGVCVFEYDARWLSDGFSLSPTELPLQSGLFYADKEKLGGAF
ncbi:MAG: HipA N-terminal domain-containing protein, partial [Bacteroidales bacterium]|nr:HipA N-terminal domain-containing protein [Bacteroidales bacterium]